MTSTVGRPTAEFSTANGPVRSELEFLAGGGEAGARIRALDWSRTPVGSPELWPQSLKTIVRVMLDSRYAMWMLWGPGLTFFCNDAYLPTLGIKRDWALGARSDKVWEEVWPDIGPRIAQVLEQGRATWDEALLLFLERSGFTEETYHTFSYSPVYDDENRIAGMLCVVTEVTERVVGERRLLILRDLAARSVGATSVEASCRGVCEVLGEHPFSMPFAAIYLIEPGSGTARRIARTPGLPESALPLILDGSSSAWPVAALLADESTQHVPDLPSAGIEIPAGPWPELVRHAFLLPLKGSGGERLSGFLIAAASPRRNLDEAYRTFFELVAGQLTAAIADAQASEAERRRAEALAEIDRAKTAFFSNVSHEFRTPLTLMLGPIEEAVVDPTAPAALRRQLELAHRNSLRLLKLVNSLLDFSRIEAGRVQASYEPTDLSALTSDLASTFRSAMERAGLDFIVECDALGEAVYVDREMWEKIVLNLLSNAFKFTFDGRVTVRLRRQGECAVLEVADTGLGVPAHELPRLFERFHRVEGTIGRTQEGSGIGLALVQELVKLHGGAIEAASELGTGTSFRVAIPLGAEHLPPERIKARRSGASTALGAQAFVQEALRWIPAATGDTSARLPAPADSARPPEDRRFARTAGSRVLLADDNADMRAYVRDLLSPTYAVETVVDGEEALRSARRERPDLILSDIMMPRLDGISLLKGLRADETLRDVPVILLSARAGEEARLEGLDAGADDYLVKPFSARELLARVGALLELTQMRRENEERFRTFVNATSDVIYRMSADWSEMRHLDGRNFIPDTRDPSRSWLDRYIHPEDQPRVTAAIGQAIRTKGIFELEHRVRRVDGTFGWTLSRAIPLMNPAGEILEWFGAASDITERMQAEQNLREREEALREAHRLAEDANRKLRESEEALREADRRKTEFLALLGHELRNPLSPISTASELLSRNPNGGAPAQTAVEVIKRQTAHLTRLVDDLLDLGRITQGRIQLKLCALDLASAIAQAIETVEPLFRLKQHRVSIISSYEPLYVHGDFARIVQCVVNILTNAAKYTDQGGEIRVVSRAEDSSAVIEISDTGAGISPELLPHVFDLFVQSDRTLDRAQGGLGIGLSVVKRLVDMHRGDVTAQSGGLGRGSTFVIRLPRIARPESAAPAESVQSPPRRVLIVDDNVDAANTLALVLNDGGHETEVVYSAREALTRAESFEPEVALLDIGLPEMDGYELARRLQAMPRLKATRLVALTGYGQNEDRQRSLEAGFHDHLVKPVDLSALERTLMGIAAAPH